LPSSAIKEFKVFLKDERVEKGGGLTSPTIRKFKALKEMKEKRRGVDRQQ
jgi:hypothetical protein